MQVHVLQYLKYNIEKKTYTNHRAIFLETCLGSFQVFSYYSNGKLQPATILISESVRAGVKLEHFSISNFMECGIKVKVRISFIQPFPSLY